MSTFESRRFHRSIAVGIVLTLLACAADQLGLLQSLDDWFYDVRAARCQFFSSKPDDRIVHIDIDDASLEPTAVGKWSWPRGTLARIITEIGRAKPAAIGLDFQLSDTNAAPNQDQSTTNPSGLPDDDELLGQALAGQKNSLLAVSFQLLNVEQESPEQIAALAELTENLELTPGDLLRKLRGRGGNFTGIYDVQDVYAHASVKAMRARVASALGRSPLTDDQLMALLLPHTDPSIRSPVLDVLRHEASVFRSRKDFQRFGFDVPPLPVPVVYGDFDFIPVPSLSKGATYCGCVNYNIFHNPTLRSIPMMVEYDHRLYPQFGFALGCAVAGADIRRARVEPHEIVIPKTAGGELRIPTHNFHYAGLNRDFSAIADIPWFGGRDWETMYDWPNYKKKINHFSVNVVWDICLTVDKIRSNNSNIDNAVQNILGGEGDFAVEPEVAKTYAASNPSMDDSAARDRIAAVTLEKLNESQMLEDFLKIPPDKRTPTEQKQTVFLQRAKASLETLPKVNLQLRTQLSTLRSNLSRSIAGKGVLVGFAAQGTFDVVNTSLMARCPGVVVHGVIAQAVLSGHWWRRSSDWVGVCLVLFLGFSATMFVSRLQPVRGAVATLLLIGAYLLINGFVLFDASNWLVPVAGPVVAISVVWSGCTLQRVIYEGFERNRVATEVAIINREMDLAHQVQAALIPKRPPKVAGLEADGWTQPASTTGGDCFDLWALTDGRLAILVADASGHGLAPAMIVSQVRTLVRAMSEMELHPHDLLQRINLRVAEDLEPGRFITVFLGFLSPDGLLEYASAGHGPQFWYACDGCDLQVLESTGAPLGCDTEWLCDDPLPPIQIAAGGTLAVFSDGIFEAIDPAGELFGIDRLKEILHAHRGQPGKVIIQHVTEAMLQWQKKQQPADDQTVVIARRISPPPAI